ncbi:hypothetical protein [Pectinatus frisingensis]|nr:hypothetical protein [Pectinatus frisingensis]
MAFWKAALKRWWSDYKKDWPWNVVVYVFGIVIGAFYSKSYCEMKC